MTTPKPVMQRRKRRRAFTLTEIAIVLGVISVILGGIWMAAGQVSEKSRITQALTQFGTVSQNMTSMFQGGYGVSVAPCAAPCDITGAMEDAQVIPQNLNSGKPNASHPWSSTGLYLIWMGGTPRQYRMSFYGISHDGCLALVTQATNCTSGQPGCPIAVYAGGSAPGHGAYAAPGTPIISTSGGFTNSQAENLCSTTACGGTCNKYPSGPPNSLEFDFSQ